MSEIKQLFPKISRPVEYVAFLTFIAPTHEGPAYIFMGCDGYTEFAFHIGVEHDESPETVINAVAKLTKHKDFAPHMHQGFTIVFDRWEELSQNFKAIVEPLNGKILFNKNFHTKIAAPLVEGMGQFLREGPGRVD